MPAPHNVHSDFASAFKIFYVMGPFQFVVEYSSKNSESFTNGYWRIIEV